jgi:SAM-dependent methyltransferase
MNFFLQSRADVDSATKFLEDNGYITSGLSCKNWEFFHVAPYLKDGALLDMGSSGSIVLDNAVKKKIVGEKVGVDLEYPPNVSSPEGMKLMRGDLMETGLPDESFDIVTSLSVLEHDVDFEKFAKEASRLLKKMGSLFVSFDYAPEKIDTSLTRLYSLRWNVLSKEDVIEFVRVCGEHGLELSGEIDWKTNEMVINPSYCSPANCEYTFGILHFIKI